MLVLRHNGNTPKKLYIYTYNTTLGPSVVGNNNALYEGFRYYNIR